MSEEAEVTISYLILCHDSPDRIVRLATRILSDDETGQVVIHFDKNSSRAKFNELKARLHGTSRCHILKHRVRCGWGQWSLVEASLRMLKEANNKFKTRYYYLLSEFCYPVQALNKLKLFLSKSNNCNYMECEGSNWIKGGIREDRVLYRHFLNKRKYPKAHRYLYKVQKKLKIKKNISEKITVKYGSQWWCLANPTVEYVLANHQKYISIFKYSWIPDESFFQTVVFSMPIACRHISNYTLTKYEFDSKGNPIIIRDPRIYHPKYYFCRKIL